MNQSEITKEHLRININVNYILTFLFSTIELIGILGNLLVIVSVCVDSRMKRSLTNRLIVHVACCDLIILLFNIPDLIQFVSSTNGNWILNEISCKLIRSILVLAQYASVLTMCMITIERYIGIVYPLRSKIFFSKTHLRQIVFFIWIFSCLCSSPNFFYLHVIEDEKTRHCFLQYSLNRIQHQQRYIIHKSIESTIFYFLPLLLQLFAYIRIATQLCRVDQTLSNSFVLKKNQKKQSIQDDIDDGEYFLDNDENFDSRITRSESSRNSLNSQKNPNLYFKTSSINNRNSPIINLKIRDERKDFNNSCRNYHILKSRRNVIKMLVVVVVIYFISFSPQVLVFILFDTNAIQHVPKFIQTPYFIAFTMLLVTISSASNPIVYTVFCNKFRESFAKILRRLCFCILPIFNCQKNANSTIIQQIPKKTNHFQGKFINQQNKQISIQIEDNF